MYNKHLVSSGQNDNTVKKISDDDTVVTMFTTGDWKPSGITGSASGNLLVCLRKDYESKVVRYSSTGTVLQEIQHDSQGQPLYLHACNIAENVNRDIIVTDTVKQLVMVVDKQGISRYSYSGKENSFNPLGIATNSFGHIFVTDIKDNNIHMLDRDGGFLRYIIPEGGIEAPCAVCMIGDTEMMIGEYNTRLPKIIKFIENKN